MVLRVQQSVEEPPDPRSLELPMSDDEVEVVEEWTLPTGLKETVSEPLDCSPPLYVPVIQSPHAQHKDQQQLSVSSLDCSEIENEAFMSKKPRLTESNGHDAEITTHSYHKHKQDQMYYLDASKERNVARFINHSCEPNLFIQNVFTDTVQKARLSLSHGLF